MKREVRKHFQKYCDVSNWKRMHHPSKGKKNYEEAEALAEEILKKLIDREPGYDGTAVMLAAVALVERYVRGAVYYSDAFEIDAPNLLDKYEDLFKGDFWMGLRQDGIEIQLSHFISGRKSFFNILGV